MMSVPAYSLPPQPEKPKLIIRSARSDEGETIKRLVTNGAFPVEMAAVMDWSHVENYWIVAEDGSNAIGCLQVVYAFPVGRLEYLGLDESLSHPQRARITKALLKAGCAMQKRAGVKFVSGTVPFQFKSYHRVLKRRGAIVTAQGHVFLKDT